MKFSFYRRVPGRLCVDTFEILILGHIHLMGFSLDPKQCGMALLSHKSNTSIVLLVESGIPIDSGPFVNSSINPHNFFFFWVLAWRKHAQKKWQKKKFRVQSVGR